MTRPDPSSGSLFDDLKTRTAVSVVLGLIAFVFVWLGGTAFAAFIAVVAVIMLSEFTRLVEAESNLEAVPRWVLVALGALSILCLSFSGLWFTITASLGLLIAATLNRTPIGWVTVFGYALIVIGAASTVHLRELGAGFPILMWILLCVAAADIGGYMFGRLYQGPKLVPSISPKKTWSGFLGGIFLSVLVAIIFSFFSGGGLLNLVFFGAVIAVVSVMGDLLESSAKRRFGVKDAGSLLPGHGGFLDRLDGMTSVMVFFGGLSFVVDIAALLTPDYVVLIGGGM